MGGELWRRQRVASTTASLADLDDTIDHELARVHGSLQRRLLLDVVQRDTEELLLFFARARWENNETRVYSLPLTELTEIPKIVRHESPVLVDAMAQDLCVGAAEQRSVAVAGRVEAVAVRYVNQ
jgi:hypothetical protein